MRAAFTMGSVLQRINDFAERRIKGIVTMLSYVGDEFVRIARTEGDYRDRTGNLRNSIGFSIVIEGDVVQRQQGGRGISPSAEAKQFMDEIVSRIKKEHPHGAVLVCVAGMDYAYWVEKKDYEVISNSAGRADSILKAVLAGDISWLK